MRTIDQAFQELRSLHEQLTHTPAPEIGPQAFVPFPPGVDPVSFAIEEASQLKNMVQSQQTAPSARPLAWIPRASLFAGESMIRFLIEVPGVDKDGLTVSVMGGELLVRGERRPPSVDPALKPVVVEQPWGAFERRFPLPSWCDSRSVKACYSQGVLDVTLDRPTDGGAGEFQVEIG